MIEVGCLMMVVGWVDDGSCLMIVLEDGGWVGCVRSMRERL